MATVALSCDHGDGLALGGVDLARHDGGAGLILRQRQLPQSAPRSRTCHNKVLNVSLFGNRKQEIA